MAETMKKILVIEDDPFMLGLLVEELKNSGFEVAVAHEGTRAVKTFQEEQPAAVILDLILPQKNGIEILREIRSSPNGNIPVIILSNVEEANYLKDAQELGVTAYLIKASVQLSEVTAKLKQALGL